MSKQEFNLSNKINQYGYNDNGTPDGDVLKVEDVKEFIKRLKEGIVLNDIYTADELFKVINRLAGDELK